MSAIVWLLRRAFEANTLRQFRAGQGLADAVARDVGDLAQSIEQPKRLQDSGIDADADFGVAGFDPLEGRAGREGALGHDRHGQPAPATGVVDIGAQLTQDALYGGGGVVGRRHLLSSYYQDGIYVARRLQFFHPWVYPLEVAGYWPYIRPGRKAMPNPASRPTKGRARAERLEARVTSEQKSLIERAAALQGRTVTDFVLTSVQDAARRAIEEHNQLALSVRDSEAFVDALLNPKPVNDRLRDTVRRYRERAGV